MSNRQKYLSKVQRRAVENESIGGYVKCISCGSVITVSMADGGHYIPRTCRATEDVPENIHPQCHHCNRFLSGNTEEYRESLILRYGKSYVNRLEDLQRASRGDEEAYSRLSPEDKERVNQRKTEKDYKDLLKGDK